MRTEATRPRIKGFRVAAARPVYYVSDRPEAYELWGEVGPDEAARIAGVIAERAGRRYPGIEFRVDHGWHDHPPALAPVSIYIEDHWLDWARGRRHA